MSGLCIRFCCAPAGANGVYRGSESTRHADAGSDADSSAGRVFAEAEFDPLLGGRSSLG